MMDSIDIAVRDADIEDLDAEIEQLRTTVAEQSERIKQLEKQRDELRAACDALLEWDFVRGFRLPYRVRDPIIAAIASVKGETK